MWRSAPKDSQCVWCVCTCANTAAADYDNIIIKTTPSRMSPLALTLYIYHRLAVGCHRINAWKGNYRTELNRIALSFARKTPNPTKTHHTWWRRRAHSEALLDGWSRRVIIMSLFDFGALHLAAPPHLSNAYHMHINPYSPAHRRIRRYFMNAFNPLRNICYLN